MSPAERREIRKDFYQRLRRGDLPTPEEISNMPLSNFDVLTQVTNHYERIVGKPQLIFSAKTIGDK